MPEVGLGIGRCEIQFGNFPREVLTWYDESGTRHFSEAEQKQLQVEQERRQKEQEQRRADQQQRRADQEQLRADQEQLKRERLEEILRARGIDPDNLP